LRQLKDNKNIKKINLEFSLNENEFYYEIRDIGEIVHELDQIDFINLNINGEFDQRSLEDFITRNHDRILRGNLKL